jgi:hypothetical protein
MRSKKGNKSPRCSLLLLPLCFRQFVSALLQPQIALEWRTKKLPRQLPTCIIFSFSGLQGALYVIIYAQANLLVAFLAARAINHTREDM